MSKLNELFSYIKSNETEKAMKLIESDSKIINEYSYGVTPFQYAIECKNESIALELLKSDQLNVHLKDNLDSSCLELAIESKMSKLVEALCARYSKQQLKDLDFRANHQETLLTYSLKIGDTDTTKALMKGLF